MNDDANLRDLRLSNRRLSQLLVRLRARQRLEAAMTASEIAELRHLEKDYDEERDGDPYR